MSELNLGSGIVQQVIYHPALHCKRCGKLTRHYFAEKEKRIYQHFEEDPRPGKSEPWEYLLLVYRCSECGYGRGWGSESTNENDNND